MEARLFHCPLTVIADGGTPGAGVDTFDLVYSGPVFSTNSPATLSTGNIKVILQ